MVAGLRGLGVPVGWQPVEGRLGAPFDVVVAADLEEPGERGRKRAPKTAPRPLATLYTCSVKSVACMLEATS